MSALEMFNDGDAFAVVPIGRLLDALSSKNAAAGRTERAWCLMSRTEKLRGRYAPPGWTGNGIEPWGLQPDPVGADGNLFYRGWLGLLLGMRRYVSGKADEDEPFDVTGYRNRRFT